MAYTIKLGAFSKLENSTAQPVMTSWAEYSVTFKEGADYSNPVLAISADFSVLYAYNYAYMLGRYYWITDIQAVRSGYCSISLKIDVLATYKSTIGNTDLYVLRSSAAADGSIKDAFYPIKATSTKYRQVQTIIDPPGPFTVPPSYQYGVIVVYVAGIDPNSGTTMIEFSPSNFKSLVSALYTQLDGLQLDDVIAQTVQYFGGNPQALISSAMWFPFPFDIDALSNNIRIGNWDSNIQGGIISDPAMQMPSCYFTLNKHPLAASRGSYLNLAPYTIYTVGVPGCGTAVLDGAKLQGETQIAIERRMDAASGQMLCEIRAYTSGQRLATMTGQCGIPINLKGNNYSPDFVKAGLSLLGGAINGNASQMANALASGINAAIDAYDSAGTSMQIGGGYAAIANMPCWLDTICYDITDADNSQEGRPLCQIRKPSNIGGYIRVADGYVEISGPLPEQQEIKRFLESGFFYN